jgi:quinol monooxygenase YgiN
MLVLNRFRVDADDAETFSQDAQNALDLFTKKSGYLDGRIGRNLDDPTLWVLQTRWADVGSYRRALSAYDVKLGAVPLLSRALDEPSAYEVLGAGGVDDLNQAMPRSP